MVVGELPCNMIRANTLWASNYCKSLEIYKSIVLSIREGFYPVYLVPKKGRLTMKKYPSILIIAVAIFFLISPSAKAASTDPYLIVNEPNDKVMVSTDKVVVSGEALPESSVQVLLNGSSMTELQIGAAGIFMYHVPITDKDNIITVKAAFPSGDSQTVSRRVYKLDSEEELPELDSLIQTFTKTFLILR